MLPFKDIARFSKFWQVKIVKPGLSFRLWGCQPSLDMSTTFANAFSQWPVFFCTLPWQIVSPGSSSQSAPEEPRPLSASQPPASRLPPAPPLLSPPKDIKLSFSAIVTVSTVDSLKILPSNLPSEKKSLLLALL